MYRRVSACLVLAAVAVAVLAGCSASPTQRLSGDWVRSFDDWNKYPDQGLQLSFDAAGWYKLSSLTPDGQTSVLDQGKYEMPDVTTLKLVSQNEGKQTVYHVVALADSTLTLEVSGGQGIWVRKGSPAANQLIEAAKKAPLSDDGNQVIVDQAERESMVSIQTERTRSGDTEIRGTITNTSQVLIMKALVSTSLINVGGDTLPGGTAQIENLAPGEMREFSAYVGTSWGVSGNLETLGEIAGIEIPATTAQDGAAPSQLRQLIPSN